MTLLDSSFVRFVLVGAFFALAYSTLVALLVGAGELPPFLTSMVVFAIAIPLAFNAHRHFSFRGGAVRKGGFLSYALVQVTSFGFVSAIMSRFVTGEFWRDATLYLFTVGVAAGLTFLATRFFVFGPRAPAPHQPSAGIRKPR